MITFTLNGSSKTLSNYWSESIFGGSGEHPPPGHAFIPPDGNLKIASKRVSPLPKMEK